MRADTKLAASLLLTTAAGLGAACAPEVGPAEPLPAAGGPLPPAHAAGLSWPAGRWLWTWTATASGRQGTAELLVEADRAGGRWSWNMVGTAPPGGSGLELVPASGRTWLPLRLPAEAAGADWLPLPRLSVDSPHFADLTALLAELTRPRFGSRVTHWPARPIPVRCGAARAGEVDLSACLREAVNRWNEGLAEPWFACSDSADWGVRLVHLAGRRLTPPLWAQITRLDSLGAPLRVHIVCGDNYDDRRDSVYAVRGFVHELGHALFLWGHSPDRDHVLWAAAPPLRDTPSPDEEKAAQLWHGLPSGLDLNRYAPLIPP